MATTSCSDLGREEYHIDARLQAAFRCLCSEVPGPDFQWNSHLPLIFLRILTAQPPLNSDLCVRNWALDTNSCFKLEHFKHPISLVIFQAHRRFRELQKRAVVTSTSSFVTSTSSFVTTLGTSPPSQRLRLQPWGSHWPPASG